MKMLIVDDSPLVAPRVRSLLENLDPPVLVGDSANAEEALHLLQDIIPDIILPNTKLRVRLPFFRIVQYHHIAEKGTGVMPDIYISPVLNDAVNGVDTKMERVKEMIKQQE